MNKKLEFCIRVSDDLSVYVYGLFFYKKNTAVDDSIREFTSDFRNDKADFNECFGSYHVRIKQGNEEICFDDNAGMMRSFICKDKRTVSYSLEEAVNNHCVLPDYLAISQILYFGCTYDFHTIIQGIMYSDPNKYYIVGQAGVFEYDKKLIPFEKIKKSNDELQRIIGMIKPSIEREKMACVITGGMDSRSILANLISNGIEAELFVADSSEQADIDIAKEIAYRLNKNITIVSPITCEIEDGEGMALHESAGMAGVSGIYTLAVKAQILKEKGYLVEFGGIAGEMYKNSFINQDYPFYKGSSPNWNRFYHYKVAAWDFPEAICGDNIRDILRGIKGYVIKNIKRSGITKYNAYLDCGYHLLQSRFAPFGTMEQKYYVPYNPLLERTVAAYAFHMNPYKNEMQGYQRRQVSKNCPDIMDIRTDRGVTCNMRNIRKEKISSLLFLFKVYKKRLIDRKNVKTSSDTAGQLDMTDRRFIDAFKKCQDLEIIAKNTQYDEIPFAIKDRMIAIGYFFNKHMVSVEGNS